MYALDLGQVRSLVGAAAGANSGWRSQVTKSATPVRKPLASGCCSSWFPTGGIRPTGYGSTQARPWPARSRGAGKGGGADSRTSRRTNPLLS